MCTGLAVMRTPAPGEAVPLAVRCETDVGAAGDVTMKEIIIKFPSVSHGLAIRTIPKH